MILEKKQELKEQLKDEHYKTLADIVFDELIGRKSKRLSRGLRPMPFWLSGLILALAIFIFGVLVSLLAGQIELFLSRDVIWAIVFGVGFSYSMLIGAKFEFQMLTTTLQNSIIDAIDSIVDLEDIEDWLMSTFNRKRQFINSVIFAFVLLLLEIIYFEELFNDLEPPFVLFLLSAIVFFQLGWLLWGIIPNSVLIYKLGKYKYSLYFIDPSSSKVVRGLSNYFYGQLLIRASLAAVFTFGAANFGFLGNQGMSIVVLVVWLMLTVMFMNGQQSLSRIIREAKSESLQEIQNQILKKTKEEIADKETMDVINYLADFHDRIRDGRNSAFDLEAILRFLQSLLLPVVASILGNIERVLELLNKLFSFSQ